MRDSSILVKAAIVGVGHVGSAMHQLLPDAILYDPMRKIGSREAVNRAQLAFVCVPTPSAPDGSCDTTAVEEVIAWVQTPLIVIRSTVSVGFTAEMGKKYGKRIVFQPEYYGETPGHPYADLRTRGWITLGGAPEDTREVAAFYRSVYPDGITILQSDSGAAELAKYMTNAFLASKVIFCNEMYDLAGRCGVSYEEARRLWLADGRIGQSHTLVFPDDRGYGGSCFPKDVRALLSIAREAGLSLHQLEGTARQNAVYHGEAFPEEGME